MGARVCGIAGSWMFGDQMLGRITNIDPIPGDYRGDAHFVDIIHTTDIAEDAVVRYIARKTQMNYTFYLICLLPH